MHMPLNEPRSASQKVQRSGDSLRSLSDPETLANFARNLQEGIYITNEAGEILDANSAFLEIFGIASLEEMRRHRVDDFVDVELRKREIALMEREGSLRNRELEIKRLDGTTRTLLDTWYQLKDPDSDETLYHGILVDITDRKNLETQLREQSIRDPLTGCFNRRQLQAFYERPTSADERWGCVYADIDHFKQYNDEYGHAAGDSVLIRMSHFLMRHVRAEEPVVRMGGDEFLIILSGADLGATERVVRRLQTAALDTAPVSFSLGWAARQGKERLEDTANRADHVLIDVRIVTRPGKNTRRAEAGDDSKVS